MGKRGWRVGEFGRHSSTDDERDCKDKAVMIYFGVSDAQAGGMLHRGWLVRHCSATAAQPHDLAFSSGMRCGAGPPSAFNTSISISISPPSVSGP